MLRDLLRVVRPGGRLVTIEPGTPSGLSSVFRGAPAAQGAYEGAGGTLAALRQAGFGAVRELGDREGLKFVEGLRTTRSPALFAGDGFLETRRSAAGVSPENRPRR